MQSLGKNHSVEKITVKMAGRQIIIVAFIVLECVL